MSVVLSEHLPLLASAPDGIEKLRGLILELAVRGKLVPQDPNDEPASELLRRMAKERVRLEGEGICKKSKATALGANDAPPFELPSGWALSQLSDLTLVLNGRAYSKNELLTEGVPVLRVGNLFTSNHWYYSNLQLEDDKYCDQGDLLYSWSASFGPFIWQGPKVIYHYHIWKLRLFDESSLCKEFFYKFLLEKTAEIKAAGHGVSMIHMTKEKMEKILVSIPPLAEQHRIVAKVNELMALCDRLEAEQADAETAQAKLVETLLGTLAQSTDAAELAGNWQRLAEHFETLFTTESSLDALKQTILQLAVMGKLVPQDPDVVPIAGKLGDCVDFLNGYAFKSEWFVNSGVRLLRNANVAHGRCDWKDSVFVPAERIEEFKRFQLDLGDLVLSLDRPIINTGLKIARVTGDDLPCLLLQRVAKISPQPNAVVLDYLFLWFNSPSFTQKIDPGRSNGVPHISTKQVASIPFTRYSVAEQHRIVAKVDELNSLCDHLKADLATSRTRQTRLSATLIESALQAA